MSRIGEKIKEKLHLGHSSEDEHARPEGTTTTEEKETTDRDAPDECNIDLQSAPFTCSHSNFLKILY